MPVYTYYRKFLAETGLNDSLNVFNAWRQFYGELMLFDDEGEE